MAPKWVILMVLVMGLVLVDTVMLISTFSLTAFIVCDPMRDPMRNPVRAGARASVTPCGRTHNGWNAIVVLKRVILMVLVMGLVLVRTLMLIGTFSLTTSIVCDPMCDLVRDTVRAPASVTAHTTGGMPSWC